MATERAEAHRNLAMPARGLLVVALALAGMAATGLAGGAGVVPTIPVTVAAE